MNGKGAWPFPTSRPSERQEFVLTEEQYVEWVRVGLEGKVNVDLFWAQIGKEQGFKWWTVARGESLYAFTAEVANEHT